jgi:hypothetical protein
MSVSRFADDRGGTNFFLFGAGLASIAFNVWAAFNIYSGISAVVFAAGIFCIEIVAFLCLRHILRDLDNGHRVKPAFGFVLFGLMAVVCLFMGWRAFETKNIEIAELNKTRERDAVAFEARATIHAAAVVVAIQTGERSTETTEEARRKTEQAKADALRLEVKKNPEVPPFLAVVILIVLEGLKMFGRWAIATPTRKTPAQVARDKAIEEGKPKRTYTPRRPAEEIAAEKAAKAARKLAKAGGHIAAAN